MSSRKEESKSDSGENSSGFGWLGLGIATVVGGFIGAILALASVRTSRRPQCNTAGPSTSASNETFRNRPLTCEPCGICLDDVTLVVTLPCTHRFHAKCVENWIRGKGTCPICRMEVNPDQMKYSV